MISLKNRLDQIRNSIEIDKKIKELDRLNKQLKSCLDRKLISNCKKKIKQYEHILNEFIVLEYMLDDCKTEVEEKQLTEAIDAFEYLFFYQQQDDIKACYMDITAGSGGLESKDWVQMLLKMYLCWAKKRDIAYSIEYIQKYDIGVKSCTLKFNNKIAFVLLKGETGVHRLVRKSPFNACRHTTFASVYVYPCIDDTNTDIKIKKEDLKIDTFRSSGAGGQHVNVTDSAVRITHIPTGIITSCQKDRSQISNKKLAIQQLISKIYQQKLQQQKENQKMLALEKSDISWGNQIRSYILDKNIIKDLRTKHTRKDTENVLEGCIEDFLKIYIQKCYQKKK